MKVTLCLDGMKPARFLKDTMEEADWLMGEGTWRVSQRGAEECMWMDFDTGDSAESMYRLVRVICFRTGTLDCPWKLDENEKISHVADHSSDEEGWLLTFGLRSDVEIGIISESIFKLCGRDIEQEVCCENGELTLWIWVTDLRDAARIAGKVIESKEVEHGYGLFDVFTGDAYEYAKRLMKSLKLENSLELHEEALKKLGE